MRHREPLVKHHETLLKHCATSLNTLHSMRRYRRSMQRRRRSMQRRRRSMQRRRRSMRRRRRSRGVTGDSGLYWRGVFGDCGVGITPQMCNRVTNHGDMGTFSKPTWQPAPLLKLSSRNRASMDFSFYDKPYILNIFEQLTAHPSLCGDYLNLSTVPSISALFQTNAI